MTKESFLRGAVILAFASMISRLIGLVYMVVLPRLIYDDGMGLYQLVKPIHYFAAVAAIAGLPVAISKLIAEKAALGARDEVKRVFKVGMVLVFFSGGLAALSLLFGAPWFAAHFAKDLGVKTTLALLGPACFFLALSAAFRGFFQGLQIMTPTAISQVADQVVRVGATIFLTVWLRPLGVEKAVTGIAWGFILGELTGLAVLVGYYFSQSRSYLREIPNPRYVLKTEQWAKIAKRLIILAFPAILATILWPIMQLADSLLIPLRMQAAGFSPDAIREGLGHLGMALTLSQFPNIVTVALAASLVPAISEAWAVQSTRLVRHRSEEALRIALIFGIPSFALFFALGAPLSQALFGYYQVGEPLRVLALGTITLGLIQATTGILQGLGAMSVPVLSLSLGTVVKFVLNYVFLANPNLGILGAAWATTLGWVVIAILNLAVVLKRVGRVINLRHGVFYPGAAALAAAFLAYYIHDTLLVFTSNGVASLGALGLGLIFYFLLIMITGSLTERDIHLVPVIGKPLARFFQAWGFLRR